MSEKVDERALKALAEKRAGSSPAERTILAWYLTTIETPMRILALSHPDLACEVMEYLGVSLKYMMRRIEKNAGK